MTIAKKILENKGTKNPTEIIQVPIESLKLARWHIRREEEDRESYEPLKGSIEEYGLFHPLTVAKMANSDVYTIMAGNRRFKALKELGYTKIPVNVLMERATETDIRIIKVHENLNRDELKDTEAGFGILAIYEAEGYNEKEIIKGVKSIDNWFSNNTNHKADWNAFERIHKSNAYSRQAAGRPTNPQLYDTKFTGLCKSIRFAPKYQYQLLQVVTQLDPEVLVETQKAGLSIDKKILLTHSRLRNHPEIQKNLIDEIASPKISKEQASYKVRQAITDLDSGYIHKVDNNYWYSGESREIVPKDAESTAVESIPNDFNIVKATYDLIKLLTGRALTKGEFKYTNNVIDSHKERMYKIVKSSNPRQLSAIADSLQVTQYTINEMLKIVNSELDVVQDKEQLTKK